MGDKVLLAESDVTVHVLFAPGAPPEKDQFGRELFAVSSRVLRAGDTVDADLVPPYVLEAAERGEAASLKLMRKSEADEVVAKAAQLRALAAGAPEHLYAAGWDNSHSDHLVPDSIRMANLANEGQDADGDDFSSGEVPPFAAEAAEAASDEPQEVVEADPSSDSSDLAEVAVGEGSKEEGEDKDSAEKVAESQ